MVARFPHIQNYPWKITEENAKRQYALSRRLLAGLRALLMVMFALIVWGQIESALGRATGLGAWFAPVFMGGMVLLVGGFLVMAWRAR